MSYSNDFINCYLKEGNFYLIVKKAHPTDEEFKGLMEHLDLFYKACAIKKTKVGMIIDSHELGMIDYKYAHGFSNFFKTNEDMTKNCIIASSIICENSIISGLVNAFLSLYQSVRPVKITPNLSEAIEYINQNKK